MVNAQLDATLGCIRMFAGSPARGTLTDARLLEQFLLQHDQDAFALLVKRHGPMVQKVCWRVLHHTQDAEDAMQATFLVLARHAASIQKRENLAGWLHSTACRTALRARRDAGRRRHHEREAPRMPPSQPALDLAWRELQAVLDEEIAKLPEKYRVVFVLCCLESKSRPEAAGQLGLKEGTVASRLAYARKLLQQRLTRRGLTLAGVLAAVSLSEQTGQAALPAAMVRATSAAALAFRAGPGATVPTRAAALAEGISNTLFATRCKLVALVVLAAGLAVAGSGMLAARPADPRTAAPAPAVSPPVRAGVWEPALGPALEEKGDTVTVRGRVLDPDGKPIAGADVCLGWYRGYPLEWWPWTVEPLRPARGGKSGPDGRFCFTLTRKQLYATMRTVTANPWREIQVVAASKGYGPAWRYVTAKEPKELILRLVRDSDPIRGRVVDLQGHPVAGVRVWLSHLTVGGNYLTVNAGAGFPAPVQSDKAGRFVIGGIGRDREGALHLAGPTIEHKLVALNTKAPADGGKKGRPPLEIVVGPTKPIEGTVYAGDSGKPLAGVVVYGDRKQHREAVRAVTDAQGRFRLVGLPKQARHELVFEPAAGQHYLSAMRRVADSEGLKPISVDCSLRRGVPVRFRLIDKETRQPVRARVQYTPLKKNPNYAEAEEVPGLVPTRVFQEVHTPDADQCYNLVAYPGPGVILVFGWYSGRSYLPARLTPADRQNRLDRIDPHMDFLNLAVGYRLIDTTRTDGVLQFTIELDPGRTLRGSLIGPDGKPVIGAMAYGLTYHPRNTRSVNYSSAEEKQILKTEVFTATALDAYAPRTVSFLHEERKLIGQAVLRGDEKSPVVRLHSWGTLTGRLVDTGGKPLNDVRVRLRYPSQPAPGLGLLEREVTTDRQGHFRVEGLLPDGKHTLTLGSAKKDVELTVGAALQGLAAQAGQTRDLGDIQVTVTPVKKKGKGGNE